MDIETKRKIVSIGYVVMWILFIAACIASVVFIVNECR